MNRESIGEREERTMNLTKEKKMKAKRFPSRIAITVDENSSGPTEENLLAWKDLESAEAGRVAIYELVEEFDTQEVKRKRRVGTKQWFY